MMEAGMAMKRYFFSNIIVPVKIPKNTRSLMMIIETREEEFAKFSRIGKAIEIVISRTAKRLGFIPKSRE